MPCVSRAVDNINMKYQDVIHFAYSIPVFKIYSVAVSIFFKWLLNKQLIKIFEPLIVINLMS